jgi:uncharacterized phiE125 gp8 family phage protein
MEISVTVPPSRMPLDISDVQEFLRLDTEEDLETIQTLIKSANDIAENYCNRTLIQTSYQLFHDSLPVTGDVGIRLAKGNIISIDSFKIHLDTGGSPGTEDITDYILTEENMDGKLYPLSTTSWSTTGTARYKKGVEVNFIAGYGPARSDIPHGMINALLQLVGYLYEHREGTALPANMLDLLDPYRIVTM